MRIMKDSERLCYQSFHAQLCSVLPKDNEESKVCRCKSILSTNWKDLWWNWREIWRNDQTDSCSKDWKWSQGRSEASTCWLLLQTIFLQDLKTKIIFSFSLRLLCARVSLNQRFPMKDNLKSWLAGRVREESCVAGCTGGGEGNALQPALPGLHFCRTPHFFDAIAQILDQAQ